MTNADVLCEHCGCLRGVGVHYCLHALKAKAEENWKLYTETIFQLNAAKAQRDELLEALRTVEYWASDGDMPCCYPRETIRKALEKHESNSSGAGDEKK
jgi:enoyl reductase-like protein